MMVTVTISCPTHGDIHEQEVHISKLIELDHDPEAVVAWLFSGHTDCPRGCGQELEAEIPTTGVTGP